MISKRFRSVHAVMPCNTHEFDQFGYDGQSKSLGSELNRKEPYADYLVMHIYFSLRWNRFKPLNQFKFSPWLNRCGLWFLKIQGFANLRAVLLGPIQSWLKLGQGRPKWLPLGFLELGTTLLWPPLGFQGWWPQWQLPPQLYKEREGGDTLVCSTRETLG